MRKHLNWLILRIVCVHVCVCVCCSVVSNSLWPHGQYSPWGSSVHRILQARIPEWVAIPFSSRSSQPRDRTWVSCIAGRFCTIWATREALSWYISSYLKRLEMGTFHPCSGVYIWSGWTFCWISILVKSIASAMLFFLQQSPLSCKAYK